MPKRENSFFKIEPFLLSIQDNSKFMKRKFILIFIACLPVLVPLVSFIHWKVKDYRPIKVLIYDMTVPRKSYDEHKAFSWILINQKYTTFDQLNNPAVDYQGFFPLDNFKFVTKDFRKMTHKEVIQVADSLDVAYFTDSYGIYTNEWYGDTLLNEPSSRIYGGLNINDIKLLHSLQDSGKLVMAEFNFLASPTPTAVRREAEKLLDITWTGWVGRYYDSLDTLVNDDIPAWAKVLYKKQYKKHWDFNEAGIILIHEDSKIVVLELGETLKVEIPWVYSSEYGIKMYGLPQEITYPYWFDIMQNGESNRVISKYKIYTSEKGKKLLSDHGIPDVFPCVIENLEKNYYYFCGDFCDNGIFVESAKFSGVSYLKNIFYNKYNLIDRNPFFWHFYKPMVSNIMENYYNQVSRNRLTDKVDGLKSN